MERKWKGLETFDDLSMECDKITFNEIWDKVFNNGPICWSLTLQKPK